MRLPRNVAPLTGRLVYLDTADWSYLETDQDPDAGARLQDAGRAGEATFIVTFDHLLENVGLRSGRRSRLEFMRNFPGAVILHLDGARLLRLATVDLASTLTEPGGRQYEFGCRRMLEHSLDELEMMTKHLRLIHWSTRLHAWATSTTHRPGVKITRAERDIAEKFHRLAREGSFPELNKLLHRTGKRRNGIAGTAQSLGVRAVGAIYRWTFQRGILSPASKGDFLFDELVTGVLPRGLATNVEFMSAVHEIWSDPDVLAHASPILACAKEIAKRQSPTKDQSKIRSTELDKRHACFAPMVDVFTCDKRIQPVIHQTLNLRGGAPVSVIRTRSLAHVAAALS